MDRPPGPANAGRARRLVDAALHVAAARRLAVGGGFVDGFPADWRRRVAGGDVRGERVEAAAVTDPVAARVEEAARASVEGEAVDDMAVPAVRAGQPSELAS